MPRLACYLAQQSAEKPLKAVLVWLQIDYPFSHNLDLIRNRIPEGWSLKSKHPSLGSLTSWATLGRYPTDTAEADPSEAAAACMVARAVLESVEADLREHGFIVEG